MSHDCTVTAAIDDDDVTVKMIFSIGIRPIPPDPPTPRYKEKMSSTDDDVIQMARSWSHVTCWNPQLNVSTKE